MALTRPVDAAMAEALVSIFLEVVVAPGFDDGGPRDPRRRSRTCASSSTRCLATDDAAAAAGPDRLDPDAPAARSSSARPTRSPTTRRPGRSPPDAAPTDAERLDLDLAWRLVRGVTSNAIVLVRDRRLIGMGSGQTSRVDAARGAVAKARAYAGDAALAGAACASDAFYPFPDAVEVCLAAGVTAFVQPGGSVRDAEVVAAVDAAGATMLMTGTRHFRH